MPGGAVQVRSTSVGTIKQKPLVSLFLPGRKKFVLIDRPRDAYIRWNAQLRAMKLFTYTRTNPTTFGRWKPFDPLGGRHVCPSFAQQPSIFSWKRKKNGYIRTISLSWRVGIACNRCDSFSFFAVSSRQRKLLYVSALRFKSLLPRFRSRHKTPGAVRQQQPQRVRSN